MLAAAKEALRSRRCEQPGCPDIAGRFRNAHDHAFMVQRPILIGRLRFCRSIGIPTLARRTGTRTRLHVVAADGAVRAAGRAVREQLSDGCALWTWATSCCGSRTRRAAWLLEAEPSQLVGL